MKIVTYTQKKLEKASSGKEGEVKWTKKILEKRNVENPQYTIAEIMALLDVNEGVVRELLVDAGVDVEPSKNDLTERIAYADYRKLWISRANRPEGRLLAQLLIEESTSWASSVFKF